MQVFMVFINLINCIHKDMMEVDIGVVLKCPSKPHIVLSRDK